MGEGDAVCVDFWADVCGVFYCGVYAEVEVLRVGRDEGRGRGKRGELRVRKERGVGFGYGWLV